MIKITKRLFFYAAFLLCAVLVFAADNSKTTDRPAIRVYDAEGFLVSEARIPSILHVFCKVMECEPICKEFLEMSFFARHPCLAENTSFAIRQNIASA